MPASFARFSGCRSREVLSKVDSAPRRGFQTRGEPEAYKPARERSTKTPLDRKLGPYRPEVEVTPSPVKCPEISEVLTCKVKTHRFTPTFTTRRRHGKPLWPSTVDY